MKVRFAAINRLRTEGTALLLAAARAAGASRFISQSNAFAYAPTSRVPATEDDPLYFDEPGALAEIVRAIDRSVRSVVDRDDLEGIVLRYGYFCGPGTVYAAEGSFTAEARRPRRVPRFVGRLAAGRHGGYFMTGQRGAANAKEKREPGWSPGFPGWRNVLGAFR